MKTSNLLLFCAEAGFAFLMGDAGDTTWTGIAAFETRFFAVSHCRSRRGVTFSTWRKSPKTRTGRGCFDSPSPCEPSPATTEVGLRSPFWTPLRLVQCLTLPAAIFAKTNLVQKTAALHLQTHSGRTAGPFCRLFTSDKRNAKKLLKLIC